MPEASTGSIPFAARGSKEDIARIATAHGAHNVRVFGSASHGEAGVTSDLDLLVDMSEGRNLLDLIALSNDLEDRLGSLNPRSKRPRLSSLISVAETSQKAPASARLSNSTGQN